MASNISPKCRAHSRWFGIRMSWFPSWQNVTCDDNLGRDYKKWLCQWDPNEHRPLKFGWQLVLRNIPLQVFTKKKKKKKRKHWPKAVHRGVPKNQGSRKEEKKERILLSPSVVAKGTQSVCLCCDWIIILLLIHVVFVFSPRTVFREAECSVPSNSTR